MENYQDTSCAILVLSVILLFEKIQFSKIYITFDTLYRCKGVLYYRDRTHKKLRSFRLPYILGVFANFVGGGEVITLIWRLTFKEREGNWIPSLCKSRRVGQIESCYTISPMCIHFFRKTHKEVNIPIKVKEGKLVISNENTLKTNHLQWERRYRNKSAQEIKYGAMY